MRALTIAGFAALVVLLPTAPATAACLLCTCTASADPMSFGSYNPLSTTPLDGTGAVRVRCSLIGIGPLPLLVSYDIGLSAGASGSTGQREMRQGSERLTYNLYSDAARTQVWGEAGSAGQVTVSYGTALFGTWVETPVYGRIFARQYPAAGPYSDSIVVTVSY